MKDEDRKNQVDEIEKKEAELTAAERALKELKAKTNIKLGPIPFIAGRSEKSMATWSADQN